MKDDCFVCGMLAQEGMPGGDTAGLVTTSFALGLEAQKAGADPVIKAVCEKHTALVTMTLGAIRAMSAQLRATPTGSPDR